MSKFDYCPFCGEEEILARYEPNPLGICVFAECTHCSARGGSFIEDTYDAALESVVRDWNQKTLRPNTLCHRVKRFFVQLEYDISCYWYKIKKWDF